MSHPHASGFLGINHTDYRAFASAAAVNAPCVPVCVPRRPDSSLIAAFFSCSASMHHVGKIIIPQVATISFKTSLFRYLLPTPHIPMFVLKQTHPSFPFLQNLIASSLMLYLLLSYTLPTPYRHPSLKIGSYMSTLENLETYHRTLELVSQGLCSRIRFWSCRLPVCQGRFDCALVSKSWSSSPLSSLSRPRLRRPRLTIGRLLVSLRGVRDSRILGRIGLCISISHASRDLLSESVRSVQDYVMFYLAH
jgi:hypothetical protein